LAWNLFNKKFDANDYSDNLAFILNIYAAEKGSVTALGNLGSFYFRGKTVKKDLDRAAEYYFEAIQ
jgi:TPR repeat protein